MVVSGVYEVALMLPIMGFFGAVLGALSVGASILGARSERKAQESATRSLEGIEAQRLGLSREQFEESKRLIAEGKPIRDALRDAGLKTIPQLTATSLQALTGIQQDLSREPGTGQLFNTALRRGTKGLFQNLGAFGLADSSAAGVAAGEFTEGLVAKDMQSIRDLRMRAAGFLPGAGESTLGAGINLSGQANSLQGQAGTIGALRSQMLGRSPTAGLFADLAGVGSSFATTSALLGKFGGAAGSPSGAAGSPSGVHNPLSQRFRLNLGSPSGVPSFRIGGTVGSPSRVPSFRIGGV